MSFSSTGTGFRGYGMGGGDIIIVTRPKPTYENYPVVNDSRREYSVVSQEDYEGLITTNLKTERRWKGCLFASFIFLILSLATGGTIAYVLSTTTTS